MLRTLGNVWYYLKEMLPLALVALGVLLLCRGWRKRRLADRGLVSAPAREAVLALFVAFCGGLAAITLFPHAYWSLDHLAGGGGFMDGFRDFYTWDQVLASLDDIGEILTPLQEIRRTIHAGRYWSWFLLAGNIVMFMPIGFFPRLLWRRWGWWKSVLAGFGVSVTIELAQLFTERSTDIDDVILNTLGALLGWLLVWLLERLWPRAVKACKVREVSAWT